MESKTFGLCEFLTSRTSERSSQTALKRLSGNRPGNKTTEGDLYLLHSLVKEKVI